MLERVQKVVKRALNNAGLDARVQNLDRKPGDDPWEPSGRAWKHGRLWVNEHPRYDTKLRISWHIAPQMPGIELAADCGEGEVCLMLEGPLGEFWFSVPGLWPFIERMQKLAGVERYESVNVVHATFHHNHFWWEFMHSADSWSPSTTPWWRKGSIDFESLFLGEAEIETRLVGPQSDVTIAMPEGNYRWKAQLKQRTVRRRLSAEVFTLVELESYKGHQIPVPGKGTMSYNCGPDATYSTQMPARTVEDAIGRLVAGVLRDRKRRGAREDYRIGGVHDPEAKELH